MSYLFHLQRVAQVAAHLDRQEIVGVARVTFLNLGVEASPPEGPGDVVLRPDIERRCPVAEALQPIRQRRQRRGGARFAAWHVQRVQAPAAEVGAVVEEGHPHARRHRQRRQHGPVQRLVLRPAARFSQQPAQPILVAAVLVQPEIDVHRAVLDVGADEEYVPQPVASEESLAGAHRGRHRLQPHHPLDRRRAAGERPHLRQAEARVKVQPRPRRAAAVFQHVGLQVDQRRMARRQHPFALGQRCQVALPLVEEAIVKPGAGPARRLHLHDAATHFRVKNLQRPADLALVEGRGDGRRCGPQVFEGGCR